MPSIFIFDFENFGTTSTSSFIRVIDENGSRFKIEFDYQKKGLKITKVTSDGSSEQIEILSSYANQITIR